MHNLWLDNCVGALIHSKPGALATGGDKSGWLCFCKLNRWQKTMQEFEEYQPRIARSMRPKCEDFQSEGRLKHLILAAQLTPELLEKLRRMSDMIRRLARTREGNRRLKELLSHKRAMLYFTQPSTRTFLSFMAACQILGITCNEVRDPKTSSEVKRESRTDSIRMFSSYFDVIIMRSVISDFAESCAYLMNNLERQDMRSVPIINAGAGSDEHPTQALLDMYTILRTFDFDQTADKQSSFVELQKTYSELTRGPANKTYLFCGDIGRGRTVRSLTTVLSQYENVRVVFVSPEHETLRLGDDLRRRLHQAGVAVYEFHSLDAELDGKPLLQQVDCFYMTRIQLEYGSSDEKGEIESMDLSPFHLTKQRVDLLKPYVPIMHPFPRDSVIQEIPPEIDSDPRVMYFRQARNGMWARAALLIHMFGAADDLFMLYDEFYGD